MKRTTVFIILGVLGGLVALVGAIIAVVFYATSGVTGAADKFFATARGGDMAEVYALTSAELRNTTSAGQLAAYIQENRFDQVAETSWSSRSIENNIGSVEGTLTLDDGGVVPINMQLVKEADGWKISFIELRDGGLRGGAGPQTGGGTASGVPPDDVVFSAVRFHTGVFLDAVRRNDVEQFKGFWVDTITLAELEELAAPMREAGAAEALQDARPVVEQTAPFEGGGFEVAGYLLADPWRYQYSYVFTPDGENWKIAGFHYELRERQ